MTTLDWNLVPALHALLQDHSVSRAAERIGVTTPSMSRMLGRLRQTFGDELLVRAGRRLVPTPLAVALRDRVAALDADARELLATDAALSQTARTLVIRANDALAAPWLEPLVARIRARAPRVHLAFVAEGDERPEELRDGRVDLDLGVIGDDAPELRTQLLVRDTFVAVVRRGHPLMRGRRTPARLVGFPHLAISRRGRRTGPIDAALATRKLARDIVATVPSASSAACIIAGTDWVTAMPRIVATALAARLPIAWFELGLSLPAIPISMTWHPRLDRDPAHRLLRDELRALIH
jgi:DNA-binding transcriptional LysR family regulator